MGPFPCPTVAMVPPPIPEVLSQQLQGPGAAPSISLPIIPLVDLSGSREGMPFPRTTPGRCNYGCEFVGLWSSSSFSCCPRVLVSSRSPERYQLAGAAGSPPCPAPLPVQCGRPSCACPDRQRDYESTCEPRRRYLFQTSHGQVGKAVNLGRESRYLSHRTTHLQGNQCPCQLVEQNPIESFGMGSPSCLLLRSASSLWTSDSRPLHIPEQYSADARMQKA